MMTDLSHSSEINRTNNKSHLFKSRWMGWVVMAIIILPMLMAYIVYVTGFGMPSGTLNKGELLLPATSIVDLNIVDKNSNSVDIPGNKKLWRMIIIGNSSCDKNCHDLLYLSRQVHVRLGEKANRVERIFLNTDSNFGDNFYKELEREHPRLIKAYVNANDWKSLFKETSISQQPLSGGHIYLVDQQGYAMMSYSSENSGADLLDDVKRLLKYSYEE